VGLGGGFDTRETKGVRQAETLLAAELGDGLIAPGSSKHGDNRERKDSGQRVAPTMA